jgi:hypothetical protein
LTGNGIILGKKDKNKVDCYMRLRGVPVLLIILMAVIVSSFPDALQIFDARLEIYADAEVSSAEEFREIMSDSIREVRDSIRVRVAAYDADTYNVDAIFKSILSEGSNMGYVSGCSATIITMRGKASAIIELKLQYVYPKEKILALRSETEKQANVIIDSIIKPGMSDYEKTLAVHDHIIKNSEYDQLNADLGSVPPEEHEAYGVLVKGIGVCDSYAKAMKLLLEKSGVQCLLVEGTTVEDAASVDHAWNIVKLEDEYYHIDATWNDTELSYQYFNLNDEAIRKTHQWDRSRYPLCGGVKYNYFEYNKLVAGNRAEAISMLTKAVSNRDRRLLFRISDYSAAAYDIEEMIRRASEKTRPGQGISAKWIINDSLGIIDIEFEY